MSSINSEGVKRLLPLMPTKRLCCTNLIQTEKPQTPLCHGNHGRRHPAPQLREANHGEAQADIVDYITNFYNPVRLRSTLNYQSPSQYEHRQAFAH